ncbi:hypothetical protein FE783_18685 [Paenibacillus mesophilus]|uniref:hypothetical protein n=1 Tax=Paenibacillus mesophilus TaxID=2582849 RepID=UPI00110ED11D|nr:hypothetical protein [Paenibacillus mesophilus]TMV47994.1 hypothetical protein FE783_18685 [Paenibacillus mesophilus]
MKFLSWLSKMIATVLLVAIVSAATTFYVMHAYVQQMLKSYEAVLPINQIDLTEFVANLWNGSNIVDQGGTPQKGKERAPQPDSSTGVTPPQDEAVAAWSQTGTEEGRGKDKVVISAEQFQKKREMLSEEDKVTVFSMLISQLPQDELQHISTKLEDGLTATELTEIEKIVERYLQPEQVAKLMDIVNKY